MEKQIDSKNPRVQPRPTSIAVTDIRMKKIVAVEKIVKSNEWEENKMMAAEAAKEIPAAP